MPSSRSGGRKRTAKRASAKVRPAAKRTPPAAKKARHAAKKAAAVRRAPAKAQPSAGTPPAAERARAQRIARALADAYPDARCMLDHRGPFELLVATILAAQCTDERVNRVTPPLFWRFPGPAEMAGAAVAELEGLVRSTGFFHAKTKSIKGASEALVREFPQQFPRTMEDLLRLPGVGRKTANVVLGTCFGEPAIIVDTHVRRVSQRLGLAASEDPDEIEREVQALLPEETWTRFSNSLTFHGRQCCKARGPACPSCPVKALCPWPDKTA
jgi:endonuclease III